MNPREMIFAFYPLTISNFYLTTPLRVDFGLELQVNAMHPF